MAIVPRLPKIPKIKLPKLPKLKLALPVFAIAGLTIAARAKLICALITAAFSPLQKLMQQVSNFSGDAIKAKVKGALESAKNLIKDQVVGLVNQAVAPVAQAIKAASSALDALKNAKESLSKQSKSVKSIIEGELNCISDNISVSNKVGMAGAAIKKTIADKTKTLTNNEKKEILENPKKKEEFVETCTNEAIENASNTIASDISNTPQKQVETVQKLETLKAKIDFDIIYEYPVSKLEKFSRNQLLEFLNNNLNGLSRYSKTKYPKIYAIRIAEKQRLLDDQKKFPTEPYGKYIKNPDYIIQE